MAARFGRVLVGRDAELARVREALAAPGGAGAVLVGGAGVGKSRLARASLAAAEAAGYGTARVLATRSAAAIPLGALATVLPECGDDPAAMQRARAALVDLAAPRPLVLLVDDAHLLDDASASLVLSVSSEPRIVPLLIVRTGEPCPDAVTAVWKDLGAVRIEVGPLGPEPVGRLLAGTLGGAVAPEVVSRLGQLSGGRPLALRELLAAALDGGRLVDVDGRWQLTDDPIVPRAVTDLVDERLAQLGGRVRELVATLALCEPLPVTAIEHLGLGDALEALEAGGIVTVTDAAGAPHIDAVVAADPLVDRGVGMRLDVRLDHPLYAEAVLAGTGAWRRRRLLAATAGALAEVSADGRDHVRTVLWRHWSGEVLDPARLVDAARRFYANGDYQRCGELAEAAWRAGRSFDAGHLHGFALGRQGRCQEADDVLAATAALARTDREVVLVTLARSENLARGLASPKRSEELCLAAESTVADPHWRAEVTAHRAMGLVQAGAVDEALGILGPMLDPGAVGPRAFVKAAYAAGIALVHAGRIDEAGAVAVRALPLHEELWAGDLFQTEPGVHHITTLSGMISAGRLTEVQPLLALARDLTRNALPPYGYAWMAYLSGLAALRQGLCDDALDHFGRAGDIFTSLRQMPAASWCRAGSALVAAVRGEDDRARRHLREAHRLAVDGGGLHRALVAEAEGRLALARGHDGDARAIFDHEADLALVRGDRIGAAHLLLALARCGGAASAATRIEALRDRIDGHHVDLQIAQVHTLAGRTDAPAAVALAEELAERGLWFDAAEIAAHAARRFLRDGDRRAAMRAAAFGRSALQRCQGVPAPVELASTAAIIEPLTARELEVARLAATRLSSKEIAQRLGISRRTVDNHLRNVYRKVGVASRADLATVLAGDPP